MKTQIILEVLGKMFITFSCITLVLALCTFISSATFFLRGSWEDVANKIRTILLTTFLISVGMMLMSLLGLNIISPSKTQKKESSTKYSFRKENDFDKFKRLDNERRIVHQKREIDDLRSRVDMQNEEAKLYREARKFLLAEDSVDSLKK